MNNVDAKVSNGTILDGIHNVNSSSPTIRRCTMEGIRGLYVEAGSTATISQSTIIGDAGDTGTMTCVSSDNGLDAQLATNGCVDPTPSWLPRNNWFKSN